MLSFMSILALFELTLVISKNKWIKKIKEIKLRIKEKKPYNQRFEGLKVQGAVFLDQYHFSPTSPG